MAISFASLLGALRNVGTVYSYINAVVPKHNDVLYNGVRR